MTRPTPPSSELPRGAFWLPPLLALAFLFAILGYRLLFLGETLAPFAPNPWIDYGAVVMVNHSTAQTVQRLLANGEPPLWDMDVGLGVPIFSDPHNSFFSPFSALLYAFPNSYGWDALILLRLFLLLLSCYWLLAAAGIQRAVALAAALLFGFSGHVFYFVHHFHMNSLVFSPLLLLGQYGVLTSKAPRWGLLFAASSALMVFGGGLLDALLAGIFSLFVSLAFFACGSGRGAYGKRVAALARLTGFTVVGLLLASPFLIPYLELRSVSIPPYSGRSAEHFDNLWYFLGLFVNKLCVTPEDPSHYFMKHRQFLHLIGIPGFALGALTLIRSRERSRFLFAGALAFFGFFFLKLYGFGFMRWIDAVPELQDLRFVKYQGLFHLSFYLVAALGTDKALRSARRDDLGIFLAASALAAALPFAYAARHGLGPWGWAPIYACLPLATALLLLWGRGAIGAQRPGARLLLPAALALLVWFQVRADVVTAFAGRPERMVPNAPRIEIVREVIGKSRVFPLAGPGPRIWSGQGLRDVRHFSVVFTRRYYEFFKHFVERESCWHRFILCSDRPDRVNLAAARFLGVAYLVVDAEQLPLLERNPDSGYRVERLAADASEGRPPFYLVQLDDPDPLLSFHTRFEVADASEVLSTLARSNFRRGEPVLLEDPIPPFEPGSGPADFRASEMRWFADGWSARVRTHVTGILVARVEHFPGWRAYLDGEPVPSFRANYLFQAIRLPPGEHGIEFRYRPRSLLLGVLLAALAGILALAIELRARRRATRLSSRLPLPR